MKKLFTTLILVAAAVTSHARETIIVASPYNPGYSGQGALMAVMQNINTTQNKYNFVLENKPGAGGLLALRHSLANFTNTVSIIAAGSVELFETNQVRESDFVPVHGIGDACWAVVTNLPADESQGIKSIKTPVGTKNIFIGAVGVGSISHLMGLEVAERANIPGVTVLFKSGTEAFMNLAANNGVNTIIDDVNTVNGMKEKNPNIKMVATICKDRHPKAQHIPTLVEQGLAHVPPVINIVLAPRAMPESKRKEIGNLLDTATVVVGRDTIFEMSGFQSPVFDNISAQKFYDTRITQIKNLRKKYAKEIQSSLK